MATVGSVASGITAKTGIGGLASGMDIDGLILKMTAASRAKVTKQEQSLQKLEWKQTAYRSVAKALTEFRTKYFDSLSKTNFKGTTLFNTIRATVDDDMKAFFTATAQSNAVAGKAYVNSIRQLATAQSVTNTAAASKDLTGKKPAQFTDLKNFVAQVDGHAKDFMVTLDGVSRTIVIDDAFVKDLKTIAMSDPSSSHYIAAINDSNIAAFDLASVTDKNEQAAYLQEALQGRINELFDNPGTPPAERTITVTATPTVSDINFNFETTRAGSKLSVGYATQPTPVALTRNSGESLDSYTARVKEEERLAHNATGLGALGFKDGQSNRVDLNKSLAEIISDNDTNGKFVLAGLDSSGNQYGYYDAAGNFRELTNTNFNFIINDVRFSIDQNESLSSVMNKINSSTAGVTLSYSEVTDKFTLTSKQQGTGEHIVMGDTNRNLLAALGLSKTSPAPVNVGLKLKADGSTAPLSTSPITNVAGSVTSGQNAIAYIDNQKIERSSNEFTVNGVAYSLKAIYNYDSTATANNFIGSDPAAEVSLSPDVTDLKESIKNFVTDYNALVDLIHGMTNEEVFSDYEPLTEEQRAAMSESQVKLWEEKAKSGILRSDSTVNKILSSMRQAFLTSTDGFSLFNMGITYGNATDSWKSYGKLTVTDEAKLQSALEANPDQVRDFFTNASKGVSTKLDKIIDDAVRTTGGQGHRGSLVEIAGLPSTLSETENTLYTQMANHSKRIASLKESLKKEEDRLWRQFSAMETALAKLNEQGNYLSQYLGQKKS
ncbi:MAG: flagellar filament capping protein FliD [Clostridiales Family XIII bacterium]|jgi:flagellar hook-associated protein 2|nr:flagellar filament capping protein FliD [Clostridiales Family XIII bacterium]